MIGTTHPFAPEEIMAYVDGELPAADMRAITSHLSECAECAELAEQFRSTSQALLDWPVENAPATLAASVQNAVAQHSLNSGNNKTAVSLHIPSGSRRSWTWKRWALAGSGAFAILLIVATIFRSTSIRSERMRAYLPERAETQSAAASPMFAPPPPLPPGSRIQKATGAIVSADTSPVAQSLAPMIARTASLIIVVKDFNASRSVLDAILARHQGYSAQLDIETPQNASRNFKASLRVPAAGLPATIDELRSLGVVVNETQSGEEVSQQHTDLVARLKNARETEERFRAILEQRTGKIEDVLQVEQEIERVRGEIETMEADQKALEHRVDFATVDLQLTEEYQAHLDASSTSASTRTRNAFVNGYRNAVDTMLGIVLFFAEYGPTMLIFVVLFGVPSFILFRRYRKARARLE